MWKTEFQLSQLACGIIICHTEKTLNLSCHMPKPLQFPVFVKLTFTHFEVYWSWYEKSFRS